MDKNAARRSIIAHALPEIPFDGWSIAVLERAAIKAGFPKDEIMLLFPQGIMDAIDFWIGDADAQMQEQAAGINLHNMKIRERIAALVRLRLETYAPHREAVRKATAIYTYPQYATKSISALARTVDTIWRLAGDNSVDYNWYTKRFLLAGVYSSTFLYWLDDESPYQQHTWNFLNRRIGNVMWLGGKLAGVRKKPLR